MSLSVIPPLDVRAARMIPAGYMAKYVEPRPDWLKVERIIDIYSVSPCISDHLCSYDKGWRYNTLHFFDSSAVIRAIVQDEGISLEESTLFFYEVFEFEFDDEDHLWNSFLGKPTGLEEVVLLGEKVLEGYDVVTFSCYDWPECSPLSCNHLASEVETNTHGLLNSLDQAVRSLEAGLFDHSEPGPMRIIAVYSTAWP